MIKPSSKLLSAVLGNPISETNINKNSKVLHYGNGLSTMQSINIYELMHMMKEWAWNNGFILTSKKSYFGEWSCRIHTKLESESFTPKLHDIMLSDCEFESVTKACEWILNEK